MKQSLREKMNLLIMQRGKISYNELKSLVESNHFGKFYRMETASRQLRPSMSPMIKANHENGYIVSYEWIGKKLEEQYKAVKVEGTDKMVYIKVKV